RLELANARALDLAGLQRCRRGAALGLPFLLPGLHRRLGFAQCADGFLERGGVRLPQRRQLLRAALELADARPVGVEVRLRLGPGAVQLLLLAGEPLARLARVLDRLLQARHLVADGVVLRLDRILAVDGLRVRAAQLLDARLDLA